MDKFQNLIKVLSKHGKNLPFMNLLSQKTKLEPGLILLGTLLLITLLLLLFTGLQIPTLIVTLVYPGYQTLRALDRQKDETDWLIYWTVFGIYTLLEELLFFIFNLIPLYSLLRLGVFVYLWLPKTQGALVIYELAVSPLFAKNRATLQSKIGK